jgi:alkylation response protein AidB-like acyl-CoA dehydrogenase
MTATADLWERRSLFDDDHEEFRASVREFLTPPCGRPRRRLGEAGGHPSRGLAGRGRKGFLGLNVPEEYGGGGTEDYRLRVAMIEEMARVPAVSLAAGFATQTDIVLPYLFDFATPEQCKRWLPKMTTGEYIGAIAICVQFFGGYGYMLEYPIARAYADTRITTVFGGTTEIMKVIIARSVLGVR